MVYIFFLQVDQSSLLISQKYYLLPRNSTFLTAYEQLIYDVAEELGFGDSATGGQHVTDIVDFEIEIAKVRFGNIHLNTNMFALTCSKSHCHNHFFRYKEHYWIASRYAPDKGLKWFVTEFWNTRTPRYSEYFFHTR